MATAFVALATIGSRPVHNNAGNEISVPPPAMELIAPAAMPAAKMTRFARVMFGKAEALPPHSTSIHALGQVELGEHAQRGVGVGASVRCDRDRCNFVHARGVCCRQLAPELALPGGHRHAMDARGEGGG